MTSGLGTNLSDLGVADTLGSVWRETLPLHWPQQNLAQPFGTLDQHKIFFEGILCRDGPDTKEQWTPRDRQPSFSEVKLPHDCSEGLLSRATDAR
jgi:hypothetical protein